MNRIEFHMPALGADMESGTLAQWVKKPGDAIRRGEVIAVVETTKGLIDVESFEEGVLERIIVEPGAVVPVGAVLAHIASEAPAAAPPPVAEPAGGKKPPAALPGAAPIVRPTIPAREGAAPQTTRRRISPAARHRASELRVDLNEVEGSGAGGVVRVEDVEQFAARAQPAPADPRARMRAAIGTAMSRSKREIPHYYLEHAADFGPARAWLARYNPTVPVAERLIDGVLIAKAVALAAANIEGFNGYFRDGRFEPSPTVHVGTAIALRGGGLVAPALLDAARKDLKTLMREFSELVMRVRAGHMRSSELASATITVTSLGGDGVDALYPVINPPQVAIVGAGAITEKAWVHEGAVVPRPVLTLTLAADHRVSDGRAGAAFLRRVAGLLASPDQL